MAKKIKPEDIKRNDVSSSTIKSVGYDPETRTLVIEFKKRDGSFSALWEYSPITEQAYEDFVNADSIGYHFHANIKDNSTVDAKKIR